MLPNSDRSAIRILILTNKIPSKGKWVAFGHKIGYNLFIQIEKRNTLMNNNSNHKKALRLRNSTAEFLVFSYQSGGDGVEVRVQDGTIWLSQKQMGTVFDTSSDNIGLHF